MNTDTNHPRRATASGTGAALSTTITVQVTEVSTSTPASGAKAQEPAIVDQKLVESAFLAEALRITPVLHWGINE